jgi:hypothetical protein
MRKESIRNDAGRIAYSALLPSYFIDGVFVPIFLFAVVSLAIGITKYWKDMVRVAGPNAPGWPRRHVTPHHQAHKTG